MTPLLQRVCFTLVLLLAGSAPAWAAVCRVSTTGTGANDGSDWSMTMDLQSALADLGCTEVWVREGLYVPGPQQTDAFGVRPGTEVYGGFDGTESGREQRDPVAHVTILSGDIGLDDVDTDGNRVAEAHSDIVGANSRHVVRMDGNPQSVFIDTVLDGFTITAGDNSNNNEGGGGLWCSASANVNRHCSPTLRNLVVSGNRAQYGGGIAIQGETGATSSGQLSDVVFRGNHATDGGGAMFNDGYQGASSPSLTRVEFIGNSAADEAGAMYNYGYDGASNPSLADIVFSDNTAARGGAMHNEAFSGVASPTLSRVVFSGNTATIDGGAIFNDGHQGNSSPVLVDVLFDGNDAAFGGAMYNHGDVGISRPTLAAVTFSRNTAGRGGAIYNGGFTGDSSPTLTNVTFEGNAATGGDGGAIANISSTGGESRAVLLNATFSGNTAEQAAAIFNSAAGGSSDAQLTNVILWANDSTAGPPIGNIGSGATATIDSSLVEGGCPAGSVCSDLVIGDPLLGALTGNGGFTPTMLPAPGSAAIDAGNCAGAPANDQRGVVRPQGPGCEIGAVEIAVERGGTICHVDADATPPGDGFGWDSAYTELRLALIDSTCQVVWVADGVYTPGDSVTDTLLVRAGMSVYGGFAGDEVSIEQRDPAANVAVLSGDIDGDDLDVDGNRVAEIWTDIVGSNSRHVVTLDGNIAPIDFNTVLDGFTITAGDNSNNSEGGGGLWCRAFNGATARCSPVLRKLVLSGNRAQYGGGMAIQGEAGTASTPQIVDVTFRGNRATDAGGGLFNDGIQGESSPVLVRVVFHNNSAANEAGALYNYGRNGISNPTLTDVLFDLNSALRGGAIYNDGQLGESSPVLVNATFTGNEAEQDGGAIYNDGIDGVSDPLVANATFVGNHAQVDGGAVANFDSSASFTNVTFSGNSAGESGGAVHSHEVTEPSAPEFTNAILWDNTAEVGPDFYDFFGARTTVAYANMAGGCPPSGLLSCTQVVSGDPLLGTLADNGGFTPTRLPGTGSAAIDNGTCSGTPASDQRGVPRPQGATCDLGAVEYVLAPDIFADGFE